MKIPCPSQEVGGLHSLFETLDVVLGVVILPKEDHVDPARTAVEEERLRLSGA